jgi:hypothetical protein
LFRIAPLQLEADDEQFPYYVILELGSGESRRMSIPEGVGLLDYYVPSGDQAQFVSVPRGGHKLVIRDAGGAPKATLVDLGEPGERRIHSPRWSPDGSMVAYQVTGQAPELRVINTDGTNDRKIDQGKKTVFWAYEIHWAPDSRGLGLTLSERHSEISILGPLEQLLADQVDRSSAPERQ